MKHTRTRGYRRYLRERAITHAFDIYWRQWGWMDQAFQCWFTDEGFLTYYTVSHYVDADNPFLDTNDARYAHQDNYREHVRRNICGRSADNLRLCSCYTCSGYKRYEKNRQMMREEAATKDSKNEVYDLGAKT